MRNILRVLDAPRPHWVGDGFPVRSLLSHHAQGSAISPFLLLDYAGPYAFDATTRPRGVGEHPHKGFETVTIVYNGEVEHRDSTGGEGSVLRHAADPCCLGVAHSSRRPNNRHVHWA